MGEQEQLWDQDPRDPGDHPPVEHLVPSCRPQGLPARSGRC